MKTKKKVMKHKILNCKMKVKMNLETIVMKNSKKTKKNLMMKI